MKKTLIFCLYCVVFTLIPAASILAQGGKDTLKNKPFPALEESADEGDTFYLSEIPPDEDESSPEPETTAVKRDEDPLTLEITVLNEDKSSPAPKISTVNEEYKGTDRYSYSSTDANTAVSAAESAAAAARFAAAAAQSAKAAESAAAQSAKAAESAVAAASTAAVVTAAPLQAAPPSQPQPPAVQPQPAPSRLPPQPPVRTVAPTVNIIVPPAAPPAAPPAYRPSINVTPGMPDPYCNGVYRVQVGAFSNTGLAERCFNRLKSIGFTPYYEQYGKLYRVVITGIQAADMAGVVRRLESAGFTDAWIREER